MESTTVLVARGSYLRRSLASQTKIIRGVQFELEGAAQSIQDEVRALVNEVDIVDRRLEESLQKLRETKIEEVFKPSLRGNEGNLESQEQKYVLHDFIDDKPASALRESIKAALDNVEQAKRNMDRSIQTLDQDLQTINVAIADDTVSTSATDSELKSPNLRKLLKGLENHAREMAEGLESLVKHFDLCVTAIKHTEGGGDAVAKNIAQEELPEGVGVEDFDPPAQPMTETERSEMLQVLQTDASEVDEVVAEIQDRHTEMEVQLDHVLGWKQKGERSYEQVMEAFALLEKVGTRISGYVAESSKYSTCWAEEKAKIEDGMANMEEMRNVYDNFLNAYDGLIVEVARRKAVKKQMEKAVTEAQARLQRLYDDDFTERQRFRDEQGNYLPSDIWDGLSTLPPKFEIARVDEGGAESSVELPRKTVEEALRRLKAGGSRRESVS